MSTTVSNPYSFNIVNNTSFSSPTIQSNLPQTNTLLADISDPLDVSIFSMFKASSAIKLRIR